MNISVDALAAGGLDLQFATNVLGHWYLTELLLPVLLAASTPEDKARVVTVSSNGAYLTRGVDLSTLQDGPTRRKLDTGELYVQSKLVSSQLAKTGVDLNNYIGYQGNVLISRELARRHGDAITAIAVHPGAIVTDISRHSTAVMKWILVGGKSLPGIHAFRSDVASSRSQRSLMAHM
jgi:retinol dehydrogenase 12